jgi:type-F conjugative transfer system pilin assembly protein TrbC
LDFWCGEKETAVFYKRRRKVAFIKIIKNILLSSLALPGILGFGFSAPNTAFLDELQNTSIQNQWNSIQISQSAQHSHCILFVSLGMPKQLLIAYFKQAHKLGIPVVIRGLLKNDYQVTAQRLFSILYPQHQKPILGGVEIDPLWFSKYQVQVVPTLVVFRGQESAKISGNLPISSLLNEIIRNANINAVKDSAQRCEGFK